MRMITFFIAAFILIGLSVYNHKIDAADALSKYGSRGNEVRQIQQRLKQWGYYSGSVDGIYGVQTKKAVIYFQKKNGLTADGIAGPATLRAMGISSSTSNGSAGSGYSDSDINLLARLISAESRGEVYEGQVAVGAVILNRVEHPSFPDTIAGVAYQPGAFTAITDGQINQPVAESSKRAAKDALNGWDPSGGAIYYYNPDKTSNKWIRTRPVIKRIGSHLFCK
ncbi:spore cortex-lytic enzyme [Oscillospiraceae bacterium NSJ-64]|uniref:Spore cortex-lytic enzyme n=2 Tax=Youxingia wuxianensis TaxID=2763678 RepID=A0A926IJ51_9FIRM|nr:spore cortex-lytic enzyme [Youxingia wuxianensis]